MSNHHPLTSRHTSVIYSQISLLWPLQPLTPPVKVISLCSATHIFYTSVSNLPHWYSARRLSGYWESASVFGRMRPHKLHAYSAQRVHGAVLVRPRPCMRMHDHMNKCAFICVCARTCLWLCDNGRRPSAQRTRGPWIRQKTIPVTGSNQVCTKENWFLWKTESDQGQFSHLYSLAMSTNERGAEKEERGRKWEREETPAGEKCVDLLKWKTLLYELQNGMVGFRLKAIRRVGSLLYTPLCYRLTGSHQMR